MLGPCTERGRRPKGGGGSTGNTRERKLEEERSSLGAPGEVLGVERSSYRSPGGRSGAPMEVLQGKAEKSGVPMELLQ